MNLKLRLTVMDFLQFFVWGAWLITIGRYWFENRAWSGTSFGAIFSTMGIAALFMPSLMGIVADRWVNAEKLYGALHVLGGVFLSFNVVSGWAHIALGQAMGYVGAVRRRRPG